MLTKIKTQWNRFKKWLVLLIIPIALASTVILPVETTDYIHTEKGKIYIQNIDENENETFIIKSDKERYSGSGNIDVIISVENLNKKEWGTIQLKYNKGEKIESISKYIPIQQIIDVPVYSDIEVECASSTVCYETVQTGTETRKITIDTWEDIALTQLTEKSNVLKKEFKGKYDDNEARFLFPKGITFLKINISYETSLTFKDEFIIEIFGEKGGYGVLDPLIDNILAAYHLEDVSDSAASYTLTNNNAVTFSAGKNNDAATFDQTASNYLYVNSAFGRTYSSPYSVSFWLKIADEPTVDYDISSIMIVANPGFRARILYEYNGGTRRIRFYQNTTTGTTFFDITGNTGDNAYHHYVITFSGSAIYIYKDGSATHSNVSNNGNAGNVTGTTRLDLGNTQPSGYAAALKGQIDEYYIWNRVLTGSEVTELYNSGDGFFYPFTEAEITAPALPHYWDI